MNINDKQVLQPSVEADAFWDSIVAPRKSLTRPLMALEGQAFLATKVDIPQATGSRSQADTLVILRDDGAIFSDAAIPGASSLAALPHSIELSGAAFF